MSASYNALLNKYNTLVARCQSMEETMKTKDEQWEKKSVEFKAVEDNIRKLCKLILAKDKSQINLGTENGSWGSLNVRDLIIQATQSYKKYNKERALALQQILDMAEDRQEEIDRLNIQISLLMENGADPDAYQKAVEKAEKQKTYDDAMKNADYETAKNIQKNNSKVEINDDENLGNFVAESLDEFDSFQPTEKSAVIKNSSGAIAAALEKKHQEEVTKKYVTEIDIGSYLKDMSQMQRDFIDILGSQGLSEQVEILEAITQIPDNNDKSRKTLSNQVYIAAKELQKMGMISAESVAIPLQGRSNSKIIRLTSLGMKLYMLMTNKKSVISEANNIMMEHDNIHHGYGIKAIYQSLEQSGLYNRVNMNCRKDPLVVKNDQFEKKSYIPDIIAIYGATNQKCYFEYERGFSTKDTIIEKCTKMAHFTKNLFFITDTEKSAETLLRNLIEWKKEADKRNLGVKVFLSTARYFQASNFDIKGKWMYILPEKGITPLTDTKI